MKTQTLLSVILFTFCLNASATDLVLGDNPRDGFAFSYILRTFESVRTAASVVSLVSGNAVVSSMRISMEDSWKGCNLDVAVTLRAGLEQKPVYTAAKANSSYKCAELIYEVERAKASNPNLTF